MAACREQTGISCAVVFGPHGEVEVVGHQTNREHGHGDLDAGVGNGLEEGKIIAGLVKDVGTGITTIDHVIAGTANRSSCSAWHNASSLRMAERKST